MWVGCADGGELVFNGTDRDYLDGYEYSITVESDQFDRLRAALGAEPAVDVVDLVCAHVGQIMARGERSWLGDQGIECGFDFLLVSGPMVSIGSGLRALCAAMALPALVSGCSTAADSEARTPAMAATAVPAAPVLVPAPACGEGPALLSQMSTRDKLAQLLMVGVNDAADARAVVESQHVGGIMIGSWTDLSMVSDGSLTDIANAAAPLPLAVSVDEEGGRVSRLASVIGTQPSARVLAQTQTPEQVYAIALQRGQAMRSKGITIDFAPVVDVSNAPDDTVIGDRSFGSDPAVVTDYAGAYARGLRDAGLLPVLKHFPGHGNGSGDSHTGA